MKNFERYASSVSCEDVCFQNLWTANVISSSKTWSTIKLLLAVVLRTTLLSKNFLLPIKSPRFLFRLYAMTGSSSNAILRFDFICNKFQCLLKICFTFGNI